MSSGFTEDNGNRTWLCWLEFPNPARTSDSEVSITFCSTSNTSNHLRATSILVSRKATSHLSWSAEKLFKRWSHLGNFASKFALCSSIILSSIFQFQREKKSIKLWGEIPCAVKAFSLYKFITSITSFCSLGQISNSAGWFCSFGP